MEWTKIILDKKFDKKITKEIIEKAKQELKIPILKNDYWHKVKINNIKDHIFIERHYFKDKYVIFTLCQNVYIPLNYKYDIIGMEIIFNFNKQLYFYIEYKKNFFLIKKKSELNIPENLKEIFSEEKLNKIKENLQLEIKQINLI